MTHVHTLGLNDRPFVRLQRKHYAAFENVRGQVHAFNEHSADILGRMVILVSRDTDDAAILASLDARVRSLGLDEGKARGLAIRLADEAVRCRNAYRIKAERARES